MIGGMTGLGLVRLDGPSDKMYTALEYISFGSNTLLTPTDLQDDRNKMFLLKI